MRVERYFMDICFVSLEKEATKFFGFSEFLAGLALMVLAWTIADVRYRFRIRAAPIPLQGITFSVVTMVGAATLFTDWWRAEEWFVPCGDLLTPESWQAILAGLVLLTFLSWTWFAFIRPPMFGRANAKRFAHALYGFILKGSPSELGVVADELRYSARSLIRHATERGKKKYQAIENPHDRKSTDIATVAAYSNDILLLIADRRFCKAVVENAPITALALFHEMEISKKYGIQIGIFAKNVVSIALRNKDSFLYHEIEGYDSGLIGHHKPLSAAMFGNYQLVETVGELLDPPYSEISKWDADNWEAYCRITLLTLADYISKDPNHHSYTLCRAKDCIENATYDLYKLNGLTGIWDNDAVARLRITVSFIKDSIELLNKSDHIDDVRLRVRTKYGHPAESIYDHIASLILQVIANASQVKSPQWECWTIQHNMLWNQIFGFNSDNQASKIVKFKLRRLIHDEIVNIKGISGYRGARILGFCLNVMGLTLTSKERHKGIYALQNVTLRWSVRNFSDLHANDRSLAEACLVDGLSYDNEQRIIIKTFMSWKGREPDREYLSVNPSKS